MLLRPQRVASYALILWTVIRPLSLVVENLRLTEDNAVQAVQTIGLDDTSGIPSVENSDLNITLLEIAPVMDNIVKDTTDKATGITQLSEVCFYKDKPSPPSWITDNLFGNICVSPGLTNVTFTPVSAPSTLIPFPLPPPMTEFQFSSVLSTAIRLLKYLELDFGTQSDCVCKGNSEMDRSPKLFQMAIKLLVSSVIQRLYLSILRQLRRTILDRLKFFSPTTDEPKMAIGGDTWGIISLHSRILLRWFYDFFRGFWATVGWRKNDIITATRRKCAPGLVTSLPLMAEGNGETIVALGDRSDHENNLEERDGENRLTQGLSASDTRETNTTQPSIGEQGFQKTGSDASRNDKVLEINDLESLNDNSTSQDLGATTTDLCKNMDLSMNDDTTARPASLCALSGDDKSSEFDVHSTDRSGLVDAWFEVNMSKEIPPIKVQLFDNDHETSNHLSTDNTDEHEYEGHLVTDPMEFKPIGYRYPRSEDARHTDIIESFNSQEARDYVAKRCPFLFEDPETPPLTPTLQDMEGSSSDDGNGQWETECADVTAVKVGSGNKLLGRQDITNTDPNKPKLTSEITIQIAATVAALTDSNQKADTSSVAPLGGATSRADDLTDSTPVKLITVQSPAIVAIPTDDNGQSTLIEGSHSTHSSRFETDREGLIAAREPDAVTIRGAICQDPPLAFPKIDGATDEANSMSISPHATPPSNQKRDRKSSDQDTRIRLLEEAVSVSLVQPVDVWLPTYLEPELANIDVLFEAKGSTGNWQRREGLIMHLRGMLKGYTFRTFSKELASGLAKNRRLEKTLNALSSSRQTTVCLAANYYSELARTIGTDFDPFIKIVLPPLLRLSGSSHQALVTCTQMALQVIIVHGIRNPRSALSILLRDYTNETNSQIRQYTMKHLMTMLRAYGSGTSLKTLRVGSSDVVAVALKAALGDADIEVRKAARLCYWEFAEIWSKVALDIRNKMSKRAKELLDKSKLERSISDFGRNCTIEYPNVVVTEVDGEEVEPCRAQVWNGNKSYPPEAFSGAVPLIDPRYLSPFVE